MQARLFVLGAAALFLALASTSSARVGDATLSPPVAHQLTGGSGGAAPSYSSGSLPTTRRTNSTFNSTFNSTDGDEDEDDKDNNSPVIHHGDHVTIISNNNDLHKKDYETHEQIDPGYLEHQTERYEKLFHEQAIQGHIAAQARAEDEQREAQGVVEDLEKMKSMVQSQAEQIRSNQQVIEANAQRAQLIRESVVDSTLEQQRRAQSQTEHDQRVQLGEVQQHRQDVSSVVHQQLQADAMHQRRVQELHQAHAVKESQLSAIWKNKQLQQLQALHDSQSQWQAQNQQHLLDTSQRDQNEARHTLEDTQLMKREHGHAEYPAPVVPSLNGPYSMTPPVVVPAVHGSASDTTASKPGFVLPNSGMFSSDVWEHESEAKYYPQTVQQATQFHTEHLKHLEDVRKLNEVYRDVVRKHIVAEDVTSTKKVQVRQQHITNMIPILKDWGTLMNDKMKVMAQHVQKISSRVSDEKQRLEHMQTQQAKQHQEQAQALAARMAKATFALSDALNPLPNIMGAAKSGALAKA